MKENQPRKLEEINIEYTKLCTELGDILYRQNVHFPKRIEEIQTTLSGLREEASKLPPPPVKSE